VTARKLSIAVTAGLCLWASTCFAQTTAPAGAVIADIRVEGNTRTSRSAVMSYIKSRPGEPFSDKLLKEDQQRLVQTRRFDSVLTQTARTDDGVVVTFVVVERPLIAGVSIEGARGIKLDELMKEVPVSAGDPVDRFTVESGRQALLNKYLEKGYHRASVAVDEQAMANRKVVYRVTEGPQVFVRSIRFAGNKSYSSLTLRWKVETSARLWVIVPGYYDPQKVERDVTALRNFYLSEGFYDVEVGRTVDFSSDGRRATVTFVINEGPRFRVNEVRFTGSTVFNDASLAQGLLLERGSYVTSLKLERDAKKIREKYGEIGYIEARVDVRREFLPPDAAVPAWAARLDNGAPALMNVVFTIVENDQFRVGRIDIRGNDMTQSRVIRREIRVFPEQLYDTVALEESRKRLIEARLFEGESGVTITPVGDQPGVRDVLVQVKEGKTAEFLIGVGVSSDSGVLGNISFTQRNFDIAAWPMWDDIVRNRAFKGAGQTFRISAEPGTEIMRFSVDWFEPYLFDQPYALGLKGYLFDRRREDYDERRGGAQASLGHRFKNGWYGEVSWKFEGITIDGLDDDAPPEVVADKGDHLLTGPRVTLVRDTTDSRWLPSSGDRLRMSYEQLFGDYTFGRASAEYQAFKTVHVDAQDRKHILAGRLMAGQIVGEAPTFERFYGGGINSIRGFKYRGISPRSPGTDKPIGGDLMLFAGGEYTFPLVAEQLRGVVFLDSGTVEEDSSITTWRVSAGFGVRWVVPIIGPVPMSFDFGFPLVKDEFDDRQIFSFSLGWQF
jgi:outer membrane protein insertion porin family